MIGTCFIDQNIFVLYSQNKGISLFKLIINKKANLIRQSLILNKHFSNILLSIITHLKKNIYFKKLFPQFKKIYYLLLSHKKNITRLFFVDKFLIKTNIHHSEY